MQEKKRYFTDIQFLHGFREELALAIFAVGRGLEGNLWGGSGSLSSASRSKAWPLARQPAHECWPRPGTALSTGQAAQTDREILKLSGHSPEECNLGDPAWARGSNQMVASGPFQSHLFCDSCAAFPFAFQMGWHGKKMGERVISLLWGVGSTLALELDWDVWDTSMGNLISVILLSRTAHYSIKADCLRPGCKLSSFHI